MTVYNSENKQAIAVPPAQGFASPFSQKSLRTRLSRVTNKAVASAELAYKFAPGSYTAEALSDVVTIQTLLTWIDDLDWGQK
jgi:hypothetical protein